MRDAGLIPGPEDPLQESMATHSSILAWKIPWTEEPGGLQSNGVAKSWTRLKGLSTQHAQEYENVRLVESPSSTPALASCLWGTGCVL